MFLPFVVNKDEYNITSLWYETVLHRLYRNRDVLVIEP